MTQAKADVLKLLDKTPKLSNSEVADLRNTSSSSSHEILKVCLRNNLVSVGIPAFGSQKVYYITAKGRKALKEWEKNG